MKNVLCILSKSDQDYKDYNFILSQGENLSRTTVVLIGDGLCQRNLLAEHVYCVTEEEEKEGDNKHSISYLDMLNLIFASDQSFVL